MSINHWQLSYFTMIIGANWAISTQRIHVYTQISILLHNKDGSQSKLYITKTFTGIISIISKNECRKWQLL